MCVTVAAESTGTVHEVTTFLLVRHGETDWNRENRFQGHADPPLNDVGRSQARELAETLLGEGASAVYASPLRRARETAEIIAAVLGLDVRLDPRLMEVDVGSMVRPYPGRDRGTVSRVVRALAGGGARLG